MKKIYNFISKDMDAMFFIALIAYMFTEAGNLTLKDIDYDHNESFTQMRNLTVFSSYFFLALTEFGLGVKMSDSLLRFSATRKGLGKVILFTLLSFFVTQGIVVLNISNSSTQQALHYKEKTTELYGDSTWYSHPDSAWIDQVQPLTMNQSVAKLTSLEFSGNDVRSFILIESSLILTLFLTLFRNNNDYYKKVIRTPNTAGGSGSSRGSGTSGNPSGSQQHLVSYVNKLLKDKGKDYTYADLPDKAKAAIIKVWNKNAKESERKNTIGSIALNAKR